MWEEYEQYLEETAKPDIFSSLLNPLESCAEEFFAQNVFCGYENNKLSEIFDH